MGLPPRAGCRVQRPRRRCESTRWTACSSCQQWCCFGHPHTIRPPPPYERHTYLEALCKLATTSRAEHAFSIGPRSKPMRNTSHQFFGNSPLVGGNISAPEPHLGRLAARPHVYGRIGSTRQTQNRNASGPTPTHKTGECAVGSSQGWRATYTKQTLDMWGATWHPGNGRCL